MDTNNYLIISLYNSKLGQALLIKYPLNKEHNYYEININLIIFVYFFKSSLSSLLSSMKCFIALVRILHRESKKSIFKPPPFWLASYRSVDEDHTTPHTLQNKLHSIL